ncbi:hypothetical protein C8Q75DRAFT_378795 [Abortiporus biennis]|nr:hypothetical protein C8Q75DRAFT_378795 [Abortiporus biennis]
MARYGMPFFLEDKSGDITGSDYADHYSRLSFSLRCTRRDPDHMVFMIYDLLSNSSSSRHHLTVPVACFDLGHNHSLGTVKIGDGCPVEINQYLVKVNRKMRRFLASDKQEYRWTHQPECDPVWQCTNSSGYDVASYSLKLPGENYTNSSGCVLTIDEQYSHIAGELLLTLTLMRHIAKYNL